MRSSTALVLIIAGLIIFMMSACTPPPPEQPEEPDNGITETNGDTTETPTDTAAGGATDASSTTLDAENGDGKTGEEAGDVEEDVEEVEEETEDVEEETMLEPEPISDDIFGHYETWPPDSIAQEEIDILRHAVVVFETTKGTIRIRLFPDQAPLHSANCVKLVQDGYYDGLLFHRVVENFMSQGGDPEGTGRGGPGYTIPAEIGLPHQNGSMAAARTGDDVNPEQRSSGSQFYLVRNQERCAQLDGAYTVYGQIIEGLDINLALSVNSTGAAAIPGAETDSIIRAYVEMD